MARRGIIIKNTPLIIALGFLVGLFALWFGGSVYFLAPEVNEAGGTHEQSNAQENEKVLVTEVIDGDTFVIARGNFVRLIGIDAPERAEPRSEDARNALANIVLNRSVTLEADEQDRDTYGRLLRYVYAEDAFVNEILVREGYARVLTIPPNTRFADMLQEAQEEARDAGRGIWSE